MSEHTTDDRWIGSRVGPYRIEQVLEQGALGWLLEARHEQRQDACLLRVLAVPQAGTAELRRTYNGQLERYATHLMTIQHPAILPLVDYGLDGGCPYLVWPHAIMRPLSARLAQSGPIDVVTVGRYLDQIAAALDAAYQQTTLHRNLSAECAYLQLDGHVIVADFGVRRLVEVLAPDTSRSPFYGSLEACAPEQIRGERVDAYTDVYALGALAYRLLTGQPMFTGKSPEELIERHLYEQPTPLSAWRDDLPSGLEGVLAGAVAKDPVHRFPHASAFANAYHEVVTPNNRARVPLSAAMPAVGANAGANAGAFAQLVATPPPVANGRGISGASVAPRLDSGRLDSDWPRGSVSSVGSMPSGPLAGASYLLAPEADRQMLDDRPGAVPRALPSSRRRRRRFSRERIIIAAVMLVALLGSALFIVYGGTALRGGGAVTATGTVAFIDGPNSVPGHTDALQITLHGLSASASGSQYDAWLINSPDEHITALGTLTPTDHTGQSYALTYPRAGASGTPGANLLGLGDKIEVTLEQGPVKAPVGRVVLMATFPPQAFVHIRHLLFSFPTTPGQIGLLVGVLDQTQELDAQATALQNAAAAGRTDAVQCDAQSILDIIEGTHGAHYRPLGAACAALNITLAGDGFGLLGTGTYDNVIGYLEAATDHASLAATQPDATDTIRLHASHVEIAISNIKGWVTQADQEALQLLTSPTDAAALSGLVQSCDYAYHGKIQNPDQTANPVPGEAGAQTAYEHGQFMATLTLVPGS